MKKKLDRLLARVAEDQDAWREREAVVAAAKERLAGRTSRIRRPARRSRALLFAAALVSLLAAAVGLVSVSRTRREPPPLAFAVDDLGGLLGTWVVAPSSAEVPLSFSNGARIVLEPKTRARVATVTARGATVELERGRLTVRVPHAEQTDWTFSAGPYRVRVTGTHFDLGWESETSTFDVHVTDGSVEVTGPRIDGVRRVAKGESIHVAPPGPPAASSVRPPPRPPEPEREPSPSVVAPPPSAPAPDWGALARAGSYREAFAVAEARGFEAEVAKANAADLLLLGDASRYASRPDRARRCYTVARKKFAGTLEASRASFRLGVIDFPSTSALPAFEAFLREQPNDPLASEALGRILEIHDKAGDIESARAVAERYLATYPSGAHARLAHGILGR